MIMELLAIRKFGLGATSAKSNGGKHSKPLIDNLGHLSGYVAGIGAGAIIRTYDPYWKNMKRHHFFSKDFGKRDTRVAASKRPPQA